MSPTLLRSSAHHVYRVVRHRRLSPREFRMITRVAVWVMILIIVSGAAVRLTGSGLACPTWPKCTSTSVVAPLAINPWIEFANRLINAGIGIVAVVAVIGALIRVRRRRDLTWLSVGLIGGVLAEIVLGGITVLDKLAPQLVSAHFVLAMVFLANAVVLHHRAGMADEDIPRSPGSARPAGLPRLMVSAGQRRLAQLLVVAVSVVVVLGTIVTSTGPHGGDPQARRFALNLHDVAQIHGTSAEAFVGLTVIMVWWLAHSGAPRALLRRGEILLAVLLAQGILGYVQYATGVPSGLVEIHIAGSVAVVVATLDFYLGLTTRAPFPVPADSPPGPSIIPDDAAHGHGSAVGARIGS
ncbi:MAG: COX15/CtaA family protein [Actinomycetota bacterium]|nr:COX15/CtaA family protein [Actinomycetota bacterium]